MSEFVPYIGIAAILIVVAVLLIRVRGQRPGRVRLYAAMYGTVLEGKLFSLAALLEMCVEWLCAPDGLNRPEGFSLDAVLRLDVKEREEDFLFLIEKNGLGTGSKTALKNGMGSLSEALALLRKIPPEVLQRGDLELSEQEKIQGLLMSAIGEFLTVKSSVIL